MPFPGAGSGTAQDPYVITNVHELQAMKEDLAGYYVLANDIDASETAGWNDGKGFEPVGDSVESYFRGTFDGRGHKITGLTINRPDEGWVGLFRIAVNAAVKNVTLEEVNVTGNNTVGSLIGLCVMSEVSDCHASGIIRFSSQGGGLIASFENAVGKCLFNCTFTGKLEFWGQSGSIAGGLVAGFYAADSGEAEIEECSTFVEINFDRAVDYVGGFAGQIVYAVVKDCSSSGSIQIAGDSGESPRRLGGFVGSTSGSRFVNCSTDADVTIEFPNPSDVGGFAGYLTDSTTESCSASGNVLAQNGQYVGGFIGYMGVSYGFHSLVEESQALGSVSGKEFVGGLIGRAYGDVENSRALGDVVGEECVGGLIGQAAEYGKTIKGCHATGQVSGINYVGGIVGETYALVDNCYSTGTVSSEGGASYAGLGGVVGTAYALIRRCRSFGMVVGSGSSPAGGIVGITYLSVEDSISFGKVMGSGNAGGIGGTSYGAIKRSYSVSEVTGGASAGGLLGEGYGATIEDSQALEKVAGGTAAGGLVGRAGGMTIYRSFAAGLVVGEGETGGLVGTALYPSEVIDSYWDVEATGQATSVGGGEGKTTAEMKKRATFANWDFDTVWSIIEDRTYPFLRDVRLDINIIIEGDGQVFVDPPQGPYAPGSTVRLTAHPEMGARFARWSGDAAGKTREVEVEVLDRPPSVTATFIPFGNYLVDVAVDGQGAVRVEPVKDYYARGESVAVDTTPAANWEAVGLSGTSNIVGASARIVVAEDQDLVAHFHRIGGSPNVPEVRIDGRGFVLRSPNKDSYSPGEQITLTAVPEDGWVFVGWEGAVTGARNPLIIPNNGQILKAKFRRVPKFV